MAAWDEQAENEIRKSFEQIGRLMGEGLGNGLADGEAAVADAAESLQQALLESQRFYYQEKERIEQENDAATEAKYQRDYQNRLNKAKTEQQAEIVRRNEQLRLQKKANAAYLEELEKHSEAIEQQLKAQREKIEEQRDAVIESFEQIAKRATDSLEDLESARERMAQRMQEYGRLYDERTVTLLNAGPDGSKIVFEEILPDLSEERAQLEQYAALLQQIQSMPEIPDGLFESIRELSVEEAVLYQEALLRMDSDSRRAYLADWQAIQDLSAEVAGKSYEEETRQALREIEQELTAWYGSIPADFFKEGELSAEAFSSGFVGQLERMQAELQQAAASILSYGERVTETADSALTAVADGAAPYSVTYVLNSAGETVSEQLRSAKNHAEIQKLRGV